MILTKDPEEIRIYIMDWSRPLARRDKIATSTWIVPAGLTLVSEGIIAGNTSTAIKVSGGANGIVYTLTNTITTANSNEIWEYSGVLRATHQ